MYKSLNKLSKAPDNVPEAIQFEGLGTTHGIKKTEFLERLGYTKVDARALVKKDAPHNRLSDGEIYEPSLPRAGLERELRARGLPWVSGASTPAYEMALNRGHIFDYNRSSMQSKPLLGHTAVQVVATPQCIDDPDWEPLKAAELADVTCQTVWELLKRMVLECKTEIDFLVAQDNLLRIVRQTAWHSYYMKQWEKTVGRWAKCFRIGTYKINTSMIPESYNKKFKYFDLSNGTGIRNCRKDKVIWVLTVVEDDRIVRVLETYALGVASKTPHEIRQTKAALRASAIIGRYADAPTPAVSVAHPLGRGVYSFVVRSQTDEGVEYTCTVTPTEANLWFCTCPSFAANTDPFGQTIATPTWCKHLHAVNQAVIASRPVTPQQPATSRTDTGLATVAKHFEAPPAARIAESFFVVARALQGASDVPSPTRAALKSTLTQFACIASAEGVAPKKPVERAVRIPKLVQLAKQSKPKPKPQPKGSMQVVQRKSAIKRPLYQPENATDKPPKEGNKEIGQPTRTSKRAKTKGSKAHGD